MSKLIVIGQSVINHNARVKLSLTVTEYVLLQYFAYLWREGFINTEHLSYTKIGVREKVSSLMAKELVRDGKLLFNENNGIYEPTKEWLRAHGGSGEEFNIFYKPIMVEGKKLGWKNSNLAESRKKFADAMKKSAFEVILNAKLRYLFGKFELRSDYIMAAERFVGPKNEYLINWQLKPTTEVLLLNYVVQNHWIGMDFDLSSFYSSQVEEKKKEEHIDPNKFFS